MIPLRIIEYVVRTAVALLSLACLLVAGFGLFFGLGMATAGAGTGEPHMGVTDALWIGGTSFYLLFCFISVFPFFRGQRLWLGGIIAHLLLVPWIPLYLRHGSSNRWMSYTLVFPLAWWLMCALRLFCERLRIQHGGEDG